MTEEGRDANTLRNITVGGRNIGGEEGYNSSGGDVMVWGCKGEMIRDTAVGRSLWQRVMLWWGLWG